MGLDLNRLRWKRIGPLAASGVLALLLWAPAVGVGATPKLSFQVPARVRAQALVLFRGRVGGGMGHVVVVQRRIGRRWRSLARGHAGPRGRFALSAPAPPRAGRMVVRVMVSRAHAVVAVSAARRILVRALPKGAHPVVISARTEILDPSVIASAPAPGQEGTLRYAGGDDVHVGQILVAGIGRATPDGLLVQVKNVRYSDGQTIVTTEPASLSQVIIVGHFSYDGNPVRLPARKASRALPHSASGTSIDPHRASWNLSATVPLTDPENGVQSMIRASAELQIIPHVDASFDAFAGGPKIHTSISVGAKADLSASLLLKLTIADLKIFYQRFSLEPVDVQVGPVPVIIVPGIVLQGRASLDEAGGVALKYSYDHLYKVEAGYDNGFYARQQQHDYVANPFSWRPTERTPA